MKLNIVGVCVCIVLLVLIICIVYIGIMRNKESFRGDKENREIEEITRELNSMVDYINSIISKNASNINISSMISYL